MVKRKISRIQDEPESEETAQAVVPIEQEGAEELEVSEDSAAAAENSVEEENDIQEKEESVKDEEFIENEDAGEEAIEPRAQAEDGHEQEEREGRARRRKRRKRKIKDKNISGDMEERREFHLAGVIFLCSAATKADCFKYHVLGLPEAKKSIVEKVTRGMKLFLFDVDQRTLHGIYKASSEGGLNLVPAAFQESKHRFPAQVRFNVQQACNPLQESKFKDAIKDNYINRHKFKTELSYEQVGKLIKMFRSGNLPPSSGLRRGQTAGGSRMRSTQRPRASPAHLQSARTNNPSRVAQVGAARGPAYNMARDEELTPHFAHPSPYVHPPAPPREYSAWEMHDHHPRLCPPPREYYSAHPRGYSARELQDGPLYYPRTGEYCALQMHDRPVHYPSIQNAPLHIDVAVQRREYTDGSYLRRGY